MLSGLDLAAPWLLLALPLLLLLPRARGWPLRMLALALLIVAIAGPTVDREEGSLAVLVDVSDSVGDAAVNLVDGQGHSWLDEAAIYRFAGETDAPDSLSAPVPPELETSATDLARALQVASAGGARRVLVLSDGAATRGDALAALPAIPVDTVHVPPRENARLVDLLVPERAAPGETIEAVAVVESDRETVATVSVRQQGGEELVVERQLPAGRTAIPFQLTVTSRSEARVEAQLSVDFEQSPIDDSRQAAITVAQDEPLLVIGDPAAARLLELQGFPVVEGTAADVQVPLDYSAVIIRGGAAQFTAGQLAQLRDYVDYGGGLMMTGGPESFGFGGWYRTPVEEALPVDSDLRTEVEVPLVAMVIVLDRSQSMATGNPNKLALAKEGALGVVELAYQEDLLGLITFSDRHEWAFELRPATERGKREMISSILGITTGGGTILEPAYLAAIERLRATDASLKHVIILSDGNLYDGRDPFGGGTPPDFARLAQEAARDGITTSAIAVGNSADFATMQRIAVAGGGRYHSALDVSTLPRIFTTEALTATRSLLREGPLSPVAHPHPLSELSGPVESVDAYVATSLKAGAEVLLEGEREEPVLAVGRHGLGRTAALTTDLNGWAGELAGSQELSTLLASVARWLQATPSVYSATATREGEQLRVVVDAVENGEYVNGAALRARSGGTEVPLEQVAPGRYEGFISGGEATGTVLVVEGSEIVARAPLQSPHPEFETAGGAELLGLLAERSGGEALPAEALTDYEPEVLPSGVAVWPVLAAASLLVFLVELLVRRFAPESTSAGRPVLRRS